MKQLKIYLIAFLLAGIMVVLSACGDRNMTDDSKKNQPQTEVDNTKKEELKDLKQNEFSMEAYSDYWSDESIRKEVYYVIDGAEYTITFSEKSSYDVIEENNDFYNQLSGIEGAAPYVLKYVLEEEEHHKGALLVAIANKLLEKDIVVNDEELPDGFECEYLEGTPKYFAARRVAAENK